MANRKKEYQKDDLTVVWQPDICIHAGNCARGLIEVFNPKKRPWINVEGADKGKIMKQIDQCPSGALSYILANAIEEKLTGLEVEVEVFKNGPLAVKSDCLIHLSDGNTKNQKEVTYFCRCGASNNKPFCDGSHKKIDFQD